MPKRQSRTRSCFGPARVLLAGATLVASGCQLDDPPPKPRDVLLVTIDTARADRFSYTGAPGPGTPRIDALAREGAGFRNAISPVPLTLPAHASLLTGRLPPNHTVRDNGTFRLPEAETTLAEVLTEAGFATAAFVGADVLDAHYGLGQGFATYDDDLPAPTDAAFLHYPERRGEDVVAAATRWLTTRGDEPLFAWVHLFDPHVPYRPPEPERSLHDSPYDGEIAYTDRVVGQLLDAWNRRRGLDRTLVVITSDHGESLGEHGETTHGVLVHDATLRVPLVVRAPGMRAPKAIDDPVQLIDVMPTVLSLLGLPAPSGVQGRVLTPLLRGEPLSWSSSTGYAESLYAQLHHGCAPLVALRGPRWKLIRGVKPELYDLAADPGETGDRSNSQPEVVAELVAELESLLSEIDSGVAEPITLDEDRRQALAALGYVWSKPRSDASAPETPPRDPREALVSMRLMADADRSFASGDVAGAAAGYRAVIAEEPQSVDARVRLAQLFLATKRGAEAVTLLEEAVEVAPHEPLVHLKLGRTLEQLGRHERALAAFDAGWLRHPGTRALRDGRWRCLNRLGRFDSLQQEVERAVAADPTDGTARYARAVALFGRSDTASYRAALERELAELPGDPTLLRALSKVDSEP